MISRFIVLAGLVLGLTSIGPAAAADHDLFPSKDNSIFSDSDQLSDGAGPHLWLGTTGAGTARRALLQFDLGPIPVGSIVTDATLTLSVNRAQGSEINTSVHRLLQDWGEGLSNSQSGGGGAAAMSGDATWAHRFFNSVFWTNPGGDFQPLASATAAVGAAETKAVWSGASLVADVQSWVDNPAANFGWILIGGEGTTFSAKRLVSGDNSLASQWPVLHITVSPVPEPAAWLTMVAGLGLLGFAVRRRRV